MSAGRSNFDKSVTMLETESCRRAFDLTREDPRLRDRYGRNEYGQSFLLARRLVESGVRFVNVFWTFFDEKGCQFNLWDNHGVTTDVCGVGGARTGLDMIKHPYCTPSFDRAFSALLEDLECRGLLDETLVAVAGDFGRTPKINAMAGRDHWPNCYTQLLAGGGIRGGQVYGASDRNAAYVKDRPVSPEDFHATILHAFGLAPDATDPRPPRSAGPHLRGDAARVALRLIGCPFTPPDCLPRADRDARPTIEVLVSEGGALSHLGARTPWSGAGVPARPRKANETRKGIVSERLDTLSPLEPTGRPKGRPGD